MPDTRNVFCKTSFNLLDEDLVASCAKCSAVKYLSGAARIFCTTSFITIGKFACNNNVRLAKYKGWVHGSNPKRSNFVSGSRLCPVKYISIFNIHAFSGGGVGGQ